MQESLAVEPVATVPPIALSLSPRDCYRVHAALEFSIIEQEVCGLDPKLVKPFQDLELRFKKLLEDGGHRS